jgi:hypothetical protein
MPYRRGFGGDVWLDINSKRGERDPIGGDGIKAMTSGRGGDDDRKRGGGAVQLVATREGVGEGDRGGGNDESRGSCGEDDRSGNGGESESGPSGSTIAPT